MYRQTPLVPSHEGWSCHFPSFLPSFLWKFAKKLLLLYFFLFFFLFFSSFWLEKHSAGEKADFQKEWGERNASNIGEGSVTFEIITPFQATAPEESRFTSDHSARLYPQTHSLTPPFSFIFLQPIRHLLFSSSYTKNNPLSRLFSRMEGKYCTSVYINSNFFSLSTIDWNGSSFNDFQYENEICRFFFNVAWTKDRECRLSCSHVEYRS